MNSEKTSTAWFLYFSVFSVNILSIVYGSSFSWASTSLPKLQNKSTTPLSRPITTEESAWIAALPSLAGVFGPPLACYCSHKFGKKKTLLFTGVPVAITHLLFIFAPNVNFFFAGSFSAGIGYGFFFTTLPGYVSEIAENKNRGFLGGIMTIIISIGILLSYALGPFLSIAQLSWILLAILMCYFILFGFFVPDSAYYFVSINNRQLAEESLKKFRNQTNDQTEKELIDITNFVKVSSNEKLVIRDVLRSKAIRKAFFITNFLIFITQFSGIGVVVSYMETIFAATGSTFPPEYSAIIIGTLQVLTNTTSSYFVDSVGRKMLMLLSDIFSALALFSLATYFYLLNNNYNVESLSWLPLLSLAVFVIAFNSGLSLVPWVVMGEIFPSIVKSTCTMLLVSIMYFYSFSLIMSFPFLNVILGIAGTFWMFCGVLVLGIMFILFGMIETKGKSFHDIQKLLNKEDDDK